MKSFKNVIVPVMAFFVMGLTSCSNTEDAATYSANALKNTELMNILKQKGYQFDKDGKLELNDLANNTTSLDLSGTKLKDISGLDIFPNLKEVKLSNNGYGPVFDFNKLPKQITAVDLTGNKIYDFEGLVNAKLENDELKTTVLHNFTKLYLPATAKYNVEDLMPFYKEKGKEADIQIADADGKLQKYNTIRNIPDQYLRAFLKSLMPSLFVNETSIDISRPLPISDQQPMIMFNDFGGFDHLADVKSIEGLEYIINNPFYHQFGIMINNNKNYKLAYIAPHANIKTLVLDHISTETEIDLSKAKNLSSLIIMNNPNIEKIDLSNTLIGNQETKNFEMLSGTLHLVNCPKLQELKFNLSGVGIFATLHLIDLPLLKSVDLSFTQGFQNLTLTNLPQCEIKYSDKLKYQFNSGDSKEVELSEEAPIEFNISKDVAEKESTKAFINKYGKKLQITQ